ncbi:MAG: hypothetical protein P1T08_13520 [Acidimicrobiia bacterium]|nr:hypothetical protein [Acidimicrobiia bacterium]
MPDRSMQLGPEARRQKVDIAGIRTATAHPLDPDMVESHLLPEKEGDQLFAHAWHDGLSSLPIGSRRGRLAGTTGHIAESIVETVLVDIGYTPLWHFAAGGHGVDLVLITPQFDAVLAIEVKGTLRPGRLPSLRRADLDQMTPEWLEKSDNPGMKEWNLTAEDVFGAVFLVNFADRLIKAGVTSDFRTVLPVDRLDDLADLSWLDA